jgi:caa(3)-type oxidase subunit IV
MAEPVHHDPHDHAHHGHDAHGHDAAHEHVHEPMHYVRIYFVLLGLFAISVIGPTLGIVWLTLITAFGVAVIKASLVIKYFMHLDVEKRFVHYFLATSLVFMFLFFAAVAPDVMNHKGSNWVNVAAEEAVRKGLAEHAANPGGHGPAGGEHGAAPAEHGAPDAHGGGH